MTADGAETLALQALGFIATADGALQRLMDQSGLDREELRTRATDPILQVALLDFLLSNEALLIDFCETASVDAEAVHMARHILGGP
jgi:hypothetical protein